MWLWTAYNTPIIKYIGLATYADRLKFCLDLLVAKGYYGAENHVFLIHLDDIEFDRKEL